MLKYNVLYIVLADSLALNLTVDDHGRGIQTTIETLMKMVEALQPKSSSAEPPLPKQAPPSPPVRPRCLIMQLSTPPPSSSSALYEH